MQFLHYVMYFLDIRKIYDVLRNISKTVMNWNFKGEENKINPVENTKKYQIKKKFNDLKA